MARTSIMRRWMINSVGITLALLCVFGTAFILSVRSYYHKSVEYSLSSRINSVVAVLSQMISSYASCLIFDSLARVLVESLEDKGKLEMLVRASSGGGVGSSTGCDSEKTVGDDYNKAQLAENNRGSWGGRNDAG